jgi:hypothetical protein
VQPTASGGIVAGDDDLLLLDCKRQGFQAWVLGLKYGCIEAIVVLHHVALDWLYKLPSVTRAHVRNELSLGSLCEVESFCFPSCPHRSADRPPQWSKKSREVFETCMA